MLGSGLFNPLYMIDDRIFNVYDLLFEDHSFLSPESDEVLWQQLFMFKS